mmetsp:Transcript_9910/g.22413  ORF Transcript_9910/g.22413 Transcript_9910/m.22413 type:complete len:412 (+) Transcript_9910:1150-2385(+)
MVRSSYRDGTLVNPAKLQVLRICLCCLRLANRRLLRNLANASRQLAHVLLRLESVRVQARDTGDLPAFDEVLHDVRVVECRVRLRFFGNNAEVRKQVRPAVQLLMFHVVHEVCRHHNLLAHHVRECHHSSVRVTLQDLLDDSAVRILVTRFVRGDDAANSRERRVAVDLRMARGVSVRDPRRTLLEASVNEAQVRVVLRLRVHAASNEVLDRHLHLPHVHASCQPEVFVQKVAVTVLLGRPCSRPRRPRRSGGTRLVTHTIERVQHRHVRRKRLLRDHVADDRHKVVVGQALRTLAQLAHFVEEAVALRVGEVVLRLPRALDGLKQSREFATRKVAEVPEHLKAELCRRVRHLTVDDDGSLHDGRVRRGCSGHDVALLGRRGGGLTTTRDAFCAPACAHSFHCVCSEHVVM